MSTRDRWLDEGLAVLERDGATGLRIDRLAARVGLTKGSFHHHFDGAEAFKRAMLERYQKLVLAELDAAVSAAGPEPQAVLAGLTQRVRGTDSLLRPDLEKAVRVWAFQDADAREVQEGIDRARLAVLQSVWARILGDEHKARISALLPYLVGVGATVVLPPVTLDELQEVFELLLPLVPHHVS